VPEENSGTMYIPVWSKQKDVVINDKRSNPKINFDISSRGGIEIVVQ
jgi:hypothetical protein